MDDAQLALYPERPLLRYRGSKWRISPWILEQFPAHNVYVEAYGGGGSVLLRKPRVRSEVYNDLDGEVVQLFQVVRDPVMAARLAEVLALTPYARDEFVACYSRSSDPVENARRLVARSFMGQSSKGANRPSGFDTRCNPDGYLSRIGSLIAMPDVVLAVLERMRGVVIENVDAVSLIKRFDRPDALIYCDPPYFPRDRDRGNHYVHEMSVAGHARLADALLALEHAKVVISGYPSELYDRWFFDWRRVECATFADAGAARTECLWLNPRACS